MRAAQLAVTVKSCGLLLVVVVVEVVAAASEGMACAGSEAEVCVTVTMNLMYCAGEDDGGNFALSLHIFGHELEHLGKPVPLCGIRSDVVNVVIPL